MGRGWGRSNTVSGPSLGLQGRWPELGRNSLLQPRVPAWPQQAAWPASAAWGLAHSEPPPPPPLSRPRSLPVPFFSFYQLSPFPGAARQPEPGKRRPGAGGGVVGRGRRGRGMGIRRPRQRAPPVTPPPATRHPPTAGELGATAVARLLPHAQGERSAASWRLRVPLQEP